MFFLQTNYRLLQMLVSVSSPSCRYEAIRHNFPIMPWSKVSHAIFCVFKMSQFLGKNGKLIFYHMFYHIYLPYFTIFYHTLPYFTHISLCFNINDYEMLREPPTVRSEVGGLVVGHAVVRGSRLCQTQHRFRQLHSCTHRIHVCYIC